MPGLGGEAAVVGRFAQSAEQSGVAMLLLQNRLQVTSRSLRGYFFTRRLGF
jgi:hypothetical protein